MSQESHTTPPPAEEPFDPRKQGGQFDKIIKENIDASLPFLLEQLLGLPCHSFVKQAPDVQVTLERKIWKPWPRNLM